VNRPSRERVARHAGYLAVARAAFGGPALAAPEATLRMLGVPGARNAHRAGYFVGFFGVRELLLAAFLGIARGDVRALRPLLAFGALADVGDTAFLVRELLRRRQIEPAAVVLLATGLGGSVASIAVWREARAAPPT
jgi:hypothetical protein